MKPFAFLSLLLFVGCVADDIPDVPPLNLQVKKDTAETIKHCRIISHRGVSSYAPENSVKAIARAIEIGADAVEFDIWLSSDGEIVVFHDDSLRRMTGKSGTIHDYTLKKLQTFHLKDRYGKLSEETIPSLRDVLDAISNKIYCYIEIKQGGLEQQLYDMIKDYGIESSVTILSFGNDPLKRMSVLDTDAHIPLNLLVGEGELPSPTTTEWKNNYNHISGISVDYSVANNWAFLSRFVNEIKEINVYILNKYKDFSADNYEYIHGIITDEPEMWLALKKTR